MKLVSSLAVCLRVPCPPYTSGTSHTPQPERAEQMQTSSEPASLHSQLQERAPKPQGKRQARETGATYIHPAYNDGTGDTAYVGNHVLSCCHGSLLVLPYAHVARGVEQIRAPLCAMERLQRRVSVSVVKLSARWCPLRSLTLDSSSLALARCALHLRHW